MRPILLLITSSFKLFFNDDTFKPRLFGERSITAFLFIKLYSFNRIVDGIRIADDENCVVDAVARLIDKDGDFCVRVIACKPRPTVLKRMSQIAFIFIYMIH